MVSEGCLGLNVPLLKLVLNGFLIHRVVTLITINLFTISSIILEYSLFSVFHAISYLNFTFQPHPAYHKKPYQTPPIDKNEDLDLYHNLIDSYNFWCYFVILSPLKR